MWVTKMAVRKVALWVVQLGYSSAVYSVVQKAGDLADLKVDCSAVRSACSSVAWKAAKMAALLARRTADYLVHQ